MRCPKGSVVALIAVLALLIAPAALAALAPAVSTGSATSATASSATLGGTVNPEGQATTYQFEYGLTTAYGTTTASTSAGSGTSAMPVMAMVASLAPNTTYHFRLVATNASGTTLGSDKTFKTAKPSSPKPSSLRIKASPNPIVFGQTTTVSGSVKATGSAPTTVTLQQAPSGAGPFTTVASTTSSNGGGYSFRVSPRSNTFYRTLANGVTSSSVRVAVRFRIGLSVGTTNPTPGQLVRFHGRVAPAHNGFRVRIQRLRSNGSWHTLARPLLHATSGNASSYSIRIAVHRGGLYRATVGPDAQNARGFSREIRIRLR